MLNADRDNKVREILDFFANNNSNLKVEQVKKISALAMAYADLNNDFTDKLSRRNMQIKELNRYKDLSQQILNMSNIHGAYKDDTDCLNAIREAIYRLNNR